jgi:hypothetical protein
LALTVTHAYTATGADDPEAEINRAEWNADHVVVGAAAVLPDPGATWQANHAYAEGDRVKVADVETVGVTEVFEVAAAGTSDSSEPTWAIDEARDETTDGGVTWVWLGHVGGVGFDDYALDPKAYYLGVTVNTLAAGVRIGTSDPTAGVAATPGSLYLRNNSGNGEVYAKANSSDTGWFQLLRSDVVPESILLMDVGDAWASTTAVNSGDRVSVSGLTSDGEDQVFAATGDFTTGGSEPTWDISAPYAVTTDSTGGWRWIGTAYRIPFELLPSPAVP